MARKTTTIGHKLATEYCDDNKKLPNRTIARMLRDEHPEVFASVELARNTVRNIRGNYGKEKRKTASTKSLFRSNGKPGDFINVPLGTRQGRKPLRISGEKRILLLSDIHMPYHDEEAVLAALRKGKDSKCDGVYLNGDTIDFYQLSRWIKDPRMRNPRQEVDMVKELLAELAKHFKTRWYKFGNHEERWDTYLYQRAEDLIDFDELALKEVLRLGVYKFECVYGKQRATMGKLNVIHGHEVPRGISSPVNPARGLWLRLKQTALAGHWHKASQHTESHPIKKETSCTWSTGCLCDLHPDYASLNEWNHGFAIVNVGGGGDYQVENFLVERGKVYPI